MSTTEPRTPRPRTDRASRPGPPPPPQGPGEGSARGEVDEPGLLRWVRSQETLRTVVLACQDAGHPSPSRGDTLVIWPGCLTEEALTLAPQLLTEGAERVELAWCEAHGSSHGHDGHDDHGVAAPASGAATAEASWAALLPGLLGRAEPASRSLRHGETVRAEAPPLPRRALLGGLGEGPLDLDADQQSRAVAALRHLVGTGRVPEPDRSSGGALGSLPAAGAHLAATGCTLCAACTWACPSGALTMLAGEGTTMGLVHEVAACRGCRDCVAACPVGALEVIAGSTLAEAWQAAPSVLAAARTRRCERCEATVTAGDATLCPLCRARDRSPFLEEIPAEAERQLPPEVLATIRRSRGLG